MPERSAFNLSFSAVLRAVCGIEMLAHSATPPVATNISQTSRQCLREVYTDLSRGFGDILKPPPLKRMKGAEMSASLV